MAQGSTRIDDLQSLLKAINDYKADLAQNYQILVNAANVCDVAMGSDEISKRHINNLNEALKELKSAAEVAEEATQAVIQAINDFDRA